MRYIYQLYTDRYENGQRIHTDYDMFTGYIDVKANAESIIKERMSNTAYINKKLSETYECNEDTPRSVLKDYSDILRYSIGVTYEFTGRICTERINITQWRIK